MMTQFSTLAYFANWRTRLIYFILLPVTNLALLLLINDQYGTGFQWQIVIATVCIDATTLTLQAMAQLLVTDARLGIDVELITKAPANAYYWATKVATALLAGAALAAVNLVGALILGAPVGVVMSGIMVLPGLLGAGVVVGFTGWSLSWQMKNPYFFPNFFASVTILVAGCLVLVTKYPEWLRLFATLFPFSEPVTRIETGTGSLWISLMITGGWLLVGIVGYVIQLPQVRLARGHQY
ncbi:antibiotic transporter permease [Furfurilactobacillus sp. WILCCON 0119]